MVFYLVLGAVVVLVALGVTRSPVFKQFVRGHGSDPAQWGNRLDHLSDSIGTGSSWNDDGGGGRRETSVRSKHTRRR